MVPSTTVSFLQSVTGMEMIIMEKREPRMDPCSIPDVASKLVQKRSFVENGYSDANQTISDLGKPTHSRKGYYNLALFVKLV